MKIARISVFQVDLPLHEGSYKWSGGKSVEVFDSTVIRIDTDAGIQGHGETCPLGPFYLPFVLDESIDGIDMLLRGHADLAMDVVNIKIAKFGGLTRARQARDLCATLGVAMTIEDTWGGDIVTAAIAHLAHSTPPRHLFTATDFNSYVTVRIAANAPRRMQGRMAAPTAPGLGVTPHSEVLGEPVLVFG